MQTQWLKVVYDYFKDHADIPVIAEVFWSDRGWKRHVGRKRVSLSWLRKLQAQGATRVALTDGNRTADFTIAELIRGGTI